MIYVPCHSCKRRRSCSDRESMHKAALFGWARDLEVDCLSYQFVEFSARRCVSPRAPLYIERIKNDGHGGSLC